MAGHEMEPPASKKPCLSQPKRKHSIFLSHSGEEKSFVEQLWVDLKRVNLSAFFDQDSDSLPKGERFTSLIFEAAEQCQLAVVVLSKGYLSSKWPMLELSAFLKAKKTTNPDLKLFPLFYKLSPSDLDAKMVETEWVESWKSLVEGGKIQEKEISLWSEAVKSLLAAKNVEMEREKLLKEQLVQGEVAAEDFSKVFGDAVRELRPFNGLDFKKYGNSEVKYRAAVVDEICRCVPPIMKMDTEKIKGYGRLCEKISSMFEEVVCDEGSSNICNRAPLYLGLYGMGGVGKTTLCRAMCSYFQEEFCGRVCHIELQMDSSRERIERLKHAIQQLAGFDNRVVEMITTEEQGIECLKKQLRDQPPVFLAVDNVGDSLRSSDEAQVYLDAGLAHGSKVLVTSRSQAILKSLLKEAKYCKPIPRLGEKEAAELFLSVAAPKTSFSTLNPGEKEIVKACLGECQFADDGYSEQQYHPLVLKALGAYFHDIDEDHNVMSWEVALREENKLQRSRESKDVNGILGLNYKTLNDMQKMIFLDVAFLFNVSFPYKMDKVGTGFPLEWWDRTSRYEWEVSFIGTLHGISPFDAGMEVKTLQRKSLINESSVTLTMHDLYAEFAQMLIGREGSMERGWWVGHVEKNVGDIPELKRLLVSHDVSKLCRVPKNIEECRHLVCLVLESYFGSFKSSRILDLGLLNNLRVLIIDFCGVENIVCSCKYSGNGLYCLTSNEGCLSELRTVRVLCGRGLKSVPFLRHCGNLQSLSLSKCDLNPLDFVQGGTSVLKYLKKLEALRLVCAFRDDHQMSMADFYEILRGTLTLKNLRVFEFQLTDRRIIPDSEDPAVINLSLLQPLTSLSVLSLFRLPNFIREVKGLEQLYQLSTLSLMDSMGLRKLPDWHLLRKLQQVCFNGCCNLEDPSALLRKCSGISIDDFQLGNCNASHSLHKCVEPQCKLPYCEVCVERHRECGCYSLNEDDDYCHICDHLQQPRSMMTVTLRISGPGCLA